jgi:hypothetical protein
MLLGFPMDFWVPFTSWSLFLFLTDLFAAVADLNIPLFVVVVVAHCFNISAKMYLFLDCRRSRR